MAVGMEGTLVLMCVYVLCGWGGEAGGAVHARLRAAGFELIAPARGLAALRLALWARGSPVVAVVPARWERVLGGGGGGAVPALLSGLAPAPVSASAAAAAAAGGGDQRAGGGAA